MSIAEKLTTVAENQQAVYDAGVEKGERDLWYLMLKNGTRRDFERAFNHWGGEYIHPPYRIVPTSGALARIFENSPNLKKVEAAYFDLSQRNAQMHSTFRYCEKLEEIEDIGLPTMEYYQTFSGCRKLHTIAALNSTESTIYNGSFSNCTALENLTVVGVIGNAGFNVSACPLSHDSLMSIINALKNFTDGTTQTVTLGSTNLAKLTDTEKAIATQKGWTLA